MGRKTYRKIITSPELIEKINPKNKKLVDKFLNNFKTKRSPNSVKVYRSNFNIFFCWNELYNDNKFFVDVKKYELMDFFDYGVDELQWSSNRYAEIHSSLSSLSSFIYNMLDEKYPNFRNNMSKIEKLPKEAVRKKSIFSQEDFDRLEKYLRENNKIQQICLLKLLLASGARCSELVRFTTDLIDINNIVFDGLFLETKDKMQVKGRGRTGGHIYRYIITKIFVPIYKEWLPIREKIMKEHNQQHNSVFIKNDGSPAKVTTIRSWMRDWTDILGQPWYPHAGRHYWCSYLLNIGCEQEFVQELQHWSSSEMVKIYNDNTIKDRKWKGLDKLKNALNKNNKSDSE